MVEAAGGTASTMSQGELGPKAPGSITIEQLLALNEEIRALVHAGVPLERGLSVAARSLRGKLSRIARALGARLARGESLTQALENESKSLPALYRAVVEAGARSGRLPVALEGMARYVGGFSEARATIGLALWYPLLVLALAYSLFFGLVSWAVPRFIEAFESLGLSVSAPLRWLGRLGESSGMWWPVGPVLLAIVAVAWLRSGASARFQSPAWWWLRLFPWMKSILASYETANFAELLALLLEHQVTYPESLVLAAESTGNPRMMRAARELADAITRGEAPSAALETIDRRAFLPMLRWVLATGQAQGSLVAALRNLGQHYRKRGKYQAEKLAIFLPTILMIALGAGATLFYALALFIPLMNLLRQLSDF
jgi:type II secretory pathway component PulF